MKTLRTIGVIVAVTALSALLSGCYTQVGSVRGDRDYGYTSSDNPENSTNVQADNDTSIADSGAYNENSYEQSRRDFYDECYPPSVYVGGGWYGPWWSVGFGYDPWYWGYGPSWYGGWGYPAYWGWFPVATPYYGYYGHYGYYGYGRYYGGTRTFGITRARTGAAFAGYGTQPLYRTTAAGGASRTGVSSSQPVGVSRGRVAQAPANRRAAVRPAQRSYYRGAYRAQASRPRSGPAVRGGSRVGGRGGFSAPPASRGGAGGGRSSGGGRGRR